jgi:transposase-like protein
MDEAPMEAAPIKTIGTRRYTPEEKAEFVLMGLRNPGRISEMCRERHVAPISYSRWKKTYLSGGLDALRKGKRVTSIELEQENRMLKEVVGNLYVELECVKKKLEAVR